MRMMYTECAIVMHSETDHPMFAPKRISIKINDDGGGPCLEIIGINDEPEDGESENAFYLFEGDIDKFAKVCKAMLKQAKKGIEE